MSLVFAYGVVRAHDGAPPGSGGLDDAALREVVVGDVAVIVSDVAEEPLGRRRELLRHTQVLEAALERGPVLPLQFGTVFDDDEEVASAFLAPRAARLRELLDEVEGKVEVRLRATYDEEQILAEIVAADPGLRAPPGADVDARIALGARIAEAVQHQAHVDANAILDRLAPLARDVHEDTPTGAMMLLAAAFLLERDELDAFDEAVAAVGAEVEGRIRFRYVGPVPPASFLDLSEEV